MPARHSPALVALGTLVLCVLLIALAIGFADRPLSNWSHAALHGQAGFIWLTRIAEPVPVLACLGLAAMGLAALGGWRPGPRGRVALACCLAAVVALVAKDQLKYAFGRTWPETWINNNPSWIAGGVFGFFPFHGGPGWASFPSGHTTLIAAPMSALWLAWRSVRWLWGGLVAAVAIGLLGADYHWLSDVIAGGFLGFAAGAGMIALLRPDMLGIGSSRHGPMA